MCILEKLNFKISIGSMPPDPPTVLVPWALRPIFAVITLNCLRRACYILPMGNSQYNVTYLNYTKTFFLVSVEKGAPSVFYSDIFKGLLT